MKACVLLTILWFAFCAVKATNTTETTNTTTVLPTTPTSLNTPQETSPGNTTSVSTTTNSSSPSPNSTSNPLESTAATNTTETTNTTTALPTTPTSPNTPQETSPGNTTSVSTTTNSSSPPPSSTSTPLESTTAFLPCGKNPCIYGAKCINLVDQYVCQCPLGLYYTNTSGCQQGKIFPGDLSLGVAYNESLEDVNSKEYKQLYDYVIQFCQAAFKNQIDYKQTIILSVKSSPSTRKRLRAGERMNFAVVSLINMFDKSTNLNSLEVEGLVKKALEGFSNSSFASISQCAIQICDNRTTECIEKNDNTIADCECKPGLAKMNSQDTFCLLCANCHQEENMHCIMKEEVPHCQCMTNFHEKDGSCQECDFGYSGENCKDNYLVVIVAVAVVCGVVIVVLAGVLIYTSLRAKKESKPEKRHLLMNDYSSTREDSESIPGTNVAPRTKLFPQVQIRSSAGQGGRARNANEEGSANMAYFPEQDYDDIEHSSYEMTPRRKF